MKKRGWILAVMAMVLLSCSKKNEVVDGYQTYVIEKGSHQSSHDFGQSTSDSILNFNVFFDSTAIYVNQSEENAKDVNKLFGMTDCGIMHHMNSARIGWRWYKENLELFGYSYCNGDLEIVKIGTFHINTELKCSITCVEGNYIFEINGQKAVTKRSCKTNEHFLLYPYFGGNQTAPHRIKIRIAHQGKT